MSIFIVIFYCAISLWLLTEAWIGLREGSQSLTEKDKYSRIVIISFVVLAVYSSITLAHRTNFPIFGDTAWHLIMGTVIILIGVYIRIWSVVTLGKFFRTTVMVQEKHKVISHGPYKFIRHPSYSGALFATFGVGLGAGNWVSLLVLFSLTFIGLRYRITIEEKVLSKELGMAYQEYMTRTKKLIPFIY